VNRTVYLLIISEWADWSYEIKSAELFYTLSRAEKVRDNFLDSNENRKNCKTKIIETKL
jgi:hypothetical protein